MEYEKTERPTRRKLKEAKKRGEGPKSVELISAMLLLGATLLLYFLSPSLYKGLEELFIYSFKGAEVGQVISVSITPTLLLFLVLIATLSCAAHLVQQGWIFSWPKKGKQSLGKWEGVLFVIKLALLILCTTVFILFSLRLSSHLSSIEKMHQIIRRGFWLGLIFSLAYLVLGVFDYFVQRWKFFESMKMSKEEVKREKKESEGSGLIKNTWRNR